MSLLRSFVGIAVGIMVIAVYQLIMISVAGPGTELYTMADSGSQIEATENVSIWYDIAVLYVPAIFYGILVAGGFVRIFKLQIASGAS